MDHDHQLSKIEDRILKLEHLLENKLDGIDGDALNKWRKYIESKISALYLLVQVTDSPNNSTT